MHLTKEAVYEKRKSYHYVISTLKKTILHDYVRITRGGGTCLNAPGSYFEPNGEEYNLCLKQKAGLLRLKPSNNVSAFTLAEVLITLGIIGVVAAMTMPSLINATRNKELEAQFKKSYSVLSQALDRMNMEQGFNATYNDYSRCTNDFAEKFNKYFVMYVNCGKAGCMTQSADENGNVAIDNYSSLTGEKGNQAWFDDGQFAVADSMMIAVNHCDKPNKIMIGVDVNGINKRPNQYGKDFFLFQIDDKGKLLPFGTEGTSSNFWNGTNPDGLCNKTSRGAMNGITCAYKAASEKDYFNNLSNR